MDRSLCKHEHFVPGWEINRSKRLRMKSCRGGGGKGFQGDGFSRVGGRKKKEVFRRSIYLLTNIAKIGLSKAWFDFALNLVSKVNLILRSCFCIFRMFRFVLLSLCKNFVYTLLRLSIYHRIENYSTRFILNVCVNFWIVS